MPDHPPLAVASVSLGLHPWRVPAPAGTAGLILIPTHPRERLGAAALGHAGRCTLRKVASFATSDKAPYPTWLFVMRPAKRRRTHAKNLPSFPLLHNKHYVNFSQCSAPYAPFARRNRPSAPPGGMSDVLGLQPRKKSAGL